MQAQKKIGIVGAGPSGLMAAKYAVANGFTPIVFEKNSGVGGVWNSQNGAVWESMTTNLSKYTCCFKDHPWPEGTAIFPPSKQMTAYIQSYADRHNLQKHIIFNCTVTSLSRSNTGYQIQYSHEGVTKKQFFSFAIVASGIFLYPNIPSVQGLETFPGRVSHSKTYRNGADFKGKKVLAVGGSFTGIELVGDISKHSQMSFHSFHNTFWVLPHFLPIGPPSNGKTPKLPIDFFYNRKFYEYGQNQNPEAGRLTKNKFYSTICHQQQKIPELRIPEQNFTQQMYVTISSSYIEQVKRKKIVPKKCDIKKIEQSIVTFNDGTSESFDQIIFCTGYKSSLNFLSPEIKQIIEFNEEDRLQPVILYEEAFHPKLDNLFFIGVYKGPYFAVLELQVQLAFDHFMGIANFPCAEQIQKGLQKQRNIRFKSPREQFPHNDYIRFADEIASITSKNFSVPKFLENPQVSSEVKQNFLKMNVFPCFPNAFSFENLEGQIKESAELTAKTVVNS